MYFDHCNTLNELKAEYKRLALKHHPDAGGDTRTMQDINIEFDRMFGILKSAFNADQVKHEKPQTTETPDKFREIISKLINMDGLVVELCGSWLWIGGETYKHKDELKAAGCLWSRNKQKWYWRHKEDGVRWGHGHSSMGEIRRKYGSQVFNTKRQDEKEKLTA